MAARDSQEQDQDRDPGRGEDEDQGDDDTPMPAGMRRCIVTRAVRPRSALLRFVVDPGGGIVPDVDERLPGRGLWLSPSRDMIEMAARKRAFARAARQQVSVPEDLGDRVAMLLTRRCLDLLALARRAGQVVWGFDSVRTRLKEGAGTGTRTGPRAPALLFAARDGSADSRAKIAALAAAVAEADGRADRAPALIAGLASDELGQPLGRDHAVHVAVDQGRLADSLLESCGRLAGFRSGPMVLSLADAVAAGRRDKAPPSA
jgi:predicted RNA-binding protein YlxR (DUF448 family)